MVAATAVWLLVPCGALAQIRLISIEQEIEIGQQVNAQVRNEMPELRDAETLAYVRGIGRRLVQHAPGPKYPYAFSVVDYREINAFALPGGPVFITEGLLRHLKGEAEVAAVLGHEIAHVIARHSSERLAKQQLTQGLVSAVVLGTGDYSAGQIGQMVGGMINMKYGREDEIESDRLGLQIMAGAGYDPRAMIRVMEVLAQASGGSRQPEFFSTHPAPEDRAARIRKEIAKLQAGNYERR
jgi:beta-barrel assembly-enhancing protease